MAMSAAISNTETSSTAFTESAVTFMPRQTSAHTSAHETSAIGSQSPLVAAPVWRSNGLRERGHAKDRDRWEHDVGPEQRPGAQETGTRAEGFADESINRTSVAVRCRQAHEAVTDQQYGPAGEDIRKQCCPSEQAHHLDAGDRPRQRRRHPPDR